MADCNSCQDCSQTPPTGPVCPDTPTYTNSVCPEVIDSGCVEYNENDDLCIPVLKGSRLNIVLRNIIGYLTTLFSRFTSSSLTLSRTGACADILNIEVIPSSDIDNSFVLGTDGKPFVNKTLVNISNSECITWQKQIAGNITTFVPVLDWDCVATKVCTICDGSVAPCVAATLNIGNIEETDVALTFTPDGTSTYDVLLNNAPYATGVTGNIFISGLTPGTSYTITLITKCSTGNTSQSITSLTTVSNAACNIPSNLQIDLV